MSWRKVSHWQFFHLLLILKKLQGSRSVGPASPSFTSSTWGKRILQPTNRALCNLAEKNSENLGGFQKLNFRFWLKELTTVIWRHMVRSWDREVWEGGESYWRKKLTDQQWGDRLLNEKRKKTKTEQDNFLTKMDWLHNTPLKPNFSIPSVCFFGRVLQRFILPDCAVWQFNLLCICSYSSDFKITEAEIDRFNQN